MDVWNLLWGLGTAQNQQGKSQSSQVSSEGQQLEKNLGSLHCHSPSRARVCLLLSELCF